MRIILYHIVLYSSPPPIGLLHSKGTPFYQAIFQIIHQDSKNTIELPRGGLLKKTIELSPSREA